MKPRGRPKKIRQIEGEPDITQFSPRGKPGRPDEIELSLDEYETIRLADNMKLDHIEAASHMKISRQTFGRILGRARGKIAEGIVKGKIIRILSDQQNNPTKSSYKEEISHLKTAQKDIKEPIKKQSILS